MAPRSQTDNTSSTDVSWDGSITTRHAWYKKLDAYCNKYRTLITYGYVTAKNKVLTLSDEHSFHIHRNTVKAHTFREPFDVTSNTIKKIAGSVAYDEDEHLAHIPHRFEVNPEAIVEECGHLFQHIVDTVTNSKRVEDLRKRSQSHGYHLLVILNTQDKNPPVELSTWASAEQAKLVERGLTSVDTLGFDEFTEKYDEYNGQRIAPSEAAAIADVYRQVVSGAGDLVATRLENRIDQKGATGDVEKMIEACHHVLLKQEIKAAHASGRALAATDPRRDTPAPPRTYKRGDDDPCFICKLRNPAPPDGGHHLRKDCPHSGEPALADAAARWKPTVRPKDNKDKRARKGGGKVAAGEESGEDYDDENDGVDISEADVELSTLFSPGASKTVKLQTEPKPKTGASKVAKQDDATQQMQPCASPDSSDSEPDASTPLSRDEIQRRVKALTPKSPMADFKALEKEAQLGVSMRHGGSDSRSRHDILADCRAACELPPLPIPMGLPVESTKAAKVQAPTTATGTDKNTASAIDSMLDSQGYLTLGHLTFVNTGVGFHAYAGHTLQVASDGSLTNMHDFRVNESILHASCDPIAGPSARLRAPSGAV
jgi:hypothetical protein